MSYYLCPKCGHRDEVFGHAGARQTAEAMGVEFLGEIPLHAAIRAKSDEGRPPTVDTPDALYVRPYFAIARRVLEKLNAAADDAPKITVE